MSVATPETTAFDLVRYPAAAGHLNNMTTVLGELTESIDLHALVHCAPLVRLPDVQRLGYLLDLLGATQLADSLATWLGTRRPRAVPLSPGVPADVPLNTRWHILPNAQPEFDT